MPLTNKKIIIANWKANPATLEEAHELFSAEALVAEQYVGVETVICPPSVFLKDLAKIDPRYLGAQDVEISPEAKGFVSHVLVGHSDRRYVLGETDELINKKIKAALEAGIVPVLLVGEKEKGESRENILSEQLEKDLVGLSAEQVSQILFTYEPVWAISSQPGGQADTPENAVSAIKFIQRYLSEKYGLLAAPYLYGGSVNEKNAADFLKHPEISGAVVGGASLRAEEFANILKIVSDL